RSVRRPEVQAGIATLVERLRADREVARVSAAPTRPFVDASGRYEQIVVAGHHEYGEQPAQSFVHRLRGDLIPGSGFPEGTRVLAGGGPPQGVDFIEQAYRWFPWLVLGVLALTYLLLMR